MTAALLSAILKRRQHDFHPVVPFSPGKDKLYPFDFTERNTSLSTEEIADTERFAAYINRTLHAHEARYGFGGYDEHRTLYARSKHFDQPLTGTDNPAMQDPAASANQPKSVTKPSPASQLSPASSTTGGTVPHGSEATRTASSETEPRRLHLGIDIWGPAGTKVMAPLDGIVHSFAFNNNDSDYGATLILTHNLEGAGFHTLYGHLSLNSLKNLHEGKNIRKGDVIAEFGMRFENGNWPSHLHFQVMEDIDAWKGDYPGVCRYSEREQWLANCPDPDLLLQMRQYSLSPA